MVRQAKKVKFKSVDAEGNPREYKGKLTVYYLPSPKWPDGLKARIENQQEIVREIQEFGDGKISQVITLIDTQADFSFQEIKKVIGLCERNNMESYMRQQRDGKWCEFFLDELARLKTPTPAENPAATHQWWLANGGGVVGSNPVSVLLGIVVVIEYERKPVRAVRMLA